MQDLSHYRKSYDKRELPDAGLPSEPMSLFALWFDEAKETAGESEVNAMSVATLGRDGFPKTRIVLLKQFDEKGFVFFTNYESEKGRAIAENPNVCLSFFWPQLERQVIIKGMAQKTSAKTSDDYFATRPKGSQFGAWASNQSQVVAAREDLQSELERRAHEFGDAPVMRPDYWGGYLVRPVQIEFWQGRPNRLHDRIRFTLHDSHHWKQERLAP